MNKPALALLAISGVLGLAVAGVIVTQKPNPERVDVALAPQLQDTLVAYAGDELVVQGTARHANGCVVRANGVEAPIEDGAFTLTMPAPEVLGPSLVWIEAWCGEDRVARLVRQVQVTTPPQALNAPQSVPVARLRLQTPPLVEHLESAALDAVNARLQELLEQEVRGSDAIRFALPLDRWANAAQSWARSRLSEEAAARLDAVVPDDIGETSLTIRWGSGTGVRLSNLDVVVSENTARVQFDAAIDIDVEVSADPPLRRGGDGWDPETLHVDLARVGATLDLSAWPAVTVRDVDLVGDLCTRQQRGFWRRTCATVAPEVHTLVRGPLTEMLNERVASWSADFDVNTWLFDAFVGFGLPQDSALAWREQAESIGFDLEVERIDGHTVALVAKVSRSWLGSASSLGPASPTLADPVELTVALPLLNRGLSGLFDRPFAEVGAEVVRVIQQLDPERAAAIEATLAEVSGQGRAANAAWRDALALANLQVNSEFRLHPLLSIEDDALALALFDTRVFQGIEVDGVTLSVSAQIPMRFRRVGDGSAVGSAGEGPSRAPAFVVEPDVVGMAERLALEADGPDSTTRDDARRFGLFLEHEIRRSLGAEDGPALVDLSGMVGLIDTLPTVPAESTIGPFRVSLSRMHADMDAGGFVLGGAVLAPAP